MSLDTANKWIMLQGDEDPQVVEARALIQLAKTMREHNIVGSFDEMNGRKIFRFPQGDLFLVFIQTRPSDDLENVDLYALMGGN